MSVKLKIRLFDTYISSIMLYNSELWTITPKLEKEIDAFHRRLLRKILKLGWPKKTTNEKLYHITKAEPWSTTIQRRRLKWTGHLLRLPEETPARQSTFEVLKTYPLFSDMLKKILNHFSGIKHDQGNQKTPKYMGGTGLLFSLGCSEDAKFGFIRK